MLVATSDFRHLDAMADHRGIYEHALFAQPRPEHGYCTDDMARLLVVVSREPRATVSSHHLAEVSLRFLSDAQAVDGSYRNRMNSRGHWSGRTTVEDCWGRSIWGLGTAASHGDVDWIRQTATASLERAVQLRSPWARATAFATLGAADLLVAHPESQSARMFITDAADRMERSGRDTGWPWPEARLSYANAVLPEAMIAAGDSLDRPILLQRGLELLAWLLEHESVGGHLSVTPVGGAGPGDRRPAFDQQPIEVAALADACARAATIDRNRCWIDGVASAVAWFMGDNDGQRVMWDPETGGGFDGLQEHGVNLNQGAESTLALLSTVQHGRSLLVAAA